MWRWRKLWNLHCWGMPQRIIHYNFLKWKHWTSCAWSLYGQIDINNFQVAENLNLKHFNFFFSIVYGIFSCLCRSLMERIFWMRGQIQNSDIWKRHVPLHLCSINFHEFYLNLTLTELWYYFICLPSISDIICLK